MTRVALATAEQIHVTNGVIPPFNELPKVIVWGDRVFQLRKANETPEASALYSEVFAYHLIDALITGGSINPFAEGDPA
jgi:hypothetical protein